MCGKAEAVKLFACVAFACGTGVAVKWILFLVSEHTTYTRPASSKAIARLLFANTPEQQELEAQ